MEDKKYICKYCGKNFETSRKLGGHVSRCSKNPKITKTIQKITETRIINLNYTVYDIQCPICGKYKQIRMTLNSYNKGTYSKTCSSKCAHKLQIQNVDLEKRNKNISKGVKLFAQTCTKEQYIKAFGHKQVIGICECCGKNFIIDKNHRSIQYCSKECMIQKRHEKLSANARRRKFGGLNPETTHKHYHRGYYNNVWCDSSWELAFLVFNIENGKNIKRYDGIPLEYDYKGVKRKYYPDFQIDNELYEIKGKFYDNNYYKMKAYPNIHIISKEEIKQYTKYVSEKYGNKYWEVLYN